MTTRSRWFRRGLAVTAGGLLGLGVAAGPHARAQEQPPPPPPEPQPVPAAGAVAAPEGLNRAALDMAEQVGRLGQSIETDLGATPNGRQLAGDARELSQALAEFRETARRGGDRYQLRQAYAGIDSSWHHVQSRLPAPGNSSEAVTRDAAAVEQADQRLHRALDLNPLPAGYYTEQAAPTGMAEVQRLAHALVDRGETLAAVTRAEMVGPGGARFVQQAVDLAQAADDLHDALDLKGTVDPALQNRFAGISAAADRFEADLAGVDAPRRVRDAFRAFRATEVLARQALGLPNPAANVTGTVIVPQDQPSPVIALADQLVTQVTDFVNVFSTTAAAVPEGAFFLGDAQTLLAAATNFRQDVAQNADPGRLAFEFRDVDAIWQRLSRRTNRIARGRTGPNIQQVALMGGTVAEIHRLLAIPGVAPVVTVSPLP